MKTLKASAHPSSDIELVSYAGQNPKLRQYKPGFDWYMNAMPVLSEPLLDMKIGFTKDILEDLARNLRLEGWVEQKEMAPDTFERTILAIEPPQVTADGHLKQGAEIVVAQWGKGFASPVHGHAPGFLLETILKGKVLVHSYRMTSPKSLTVRAVRSDIVKEGTFAALFTPENASHHFKRQTIIHNFVALETTSTLHFLPEHTRDGRDNGFVAEFFETVEKLMPQDVQPITSQQAHYLRNGEVVLVRSTNVPEYGDHFIVVTGPPILKEHGLRVQDVAIQAPQAGWLLDSFSGEWKGLTLLRLTNEAAARFRTFHNIQLVNDEAVFPTA